MEKQSTPSNDDFTHTHDHHDGCFHDHGEEQHQHNFLDDPEELAHFTEVNAAFFNYKVHWFGDLLNI